MTVPRLSVQLYTVRDHLADLDGTLDRIAAFGVDAVEPFSILQETGELAAALARYGLACPTAHAPILSDELSFGGRTVTLPPPAASYAAASELGVELLIDPMVSPERWQTAEEVSRTAERLNAAAEEASAFGLRVGYHNHSFEFHTTIDGVSAYEHFVSLLDARVALELDVFWAAIAGEDVPALLGRLGDRVRALHVKDGVLGDDPFASQDGHETVALDQRPAGRGDLPFADILQAAASVEYDVVEFDQVDGDVFDAIGASIDYVRQQRAATASAP